MQVGGGIQRKKGLSDHSLTSLLIRDNSCSFVADFYQLAKVYVGVKRPTIPQPAGSAVIFTRHLIIDIDMG